MTTTGPFYRVVTSNAVRYASRRWYRQSPPFRKPLPFEYRLCVLEYWYNQSIKDSNNPGNQSYDPLAVSPTYQLALNQAYDSFKSKVADKAEIASSLGEGRQAVDMMTKRLVQMAKFVTALRSGNVAKAATALGVSFQKAPTNLARKRKFEEAWRSARNARNEPKKPIVGSFSEAFDSFGGSANYRRKWPRKPKPASRQFAEWVSDTFLEFHFGWAPLVKDIGDGVNVLQSTFPPYTVLARGASATTTGHPCSYLGDPDGRILWWRSRVQIKAHVVITNPNLWLANQLGFVNPVSWLWEWTPFSFVADWFSNVGAFLSQCTDFVGLTLTDSFTTHCLEHRETVDYWGYYLHGTTTVKGWYCMQRATGISKPALQLKPFRGFSLTRGVTAASLIVQQLKGVK